MISKFLVLLGVLGAVMCSYIPEMILTSSAQFFNKQLAVNVGPLVDKLVNNFTIANLTYDDKFEGVHVFVNLTQIKPHIQANWNTNILNVTDNHNFSILSKNVNVTLKAHIEFKIGYLKKQKGQLTIEISKLQANSYHRFGRSSCEKSLGFVLVVEDILVDSEKLDIQIKGKTIDNLIIKLLKAVLKSRIPNFINTTGRKLINEAIANFSCGGPLSEAIPIGHETYIVSLNTTDVPYFANNKILTLPIDLNLQNQVSNATNQEVDNENLHDQHVYEDKANCTLTMSSNMMDTILWLIDDSNILSFVVTKEQLGPNPPISLDTNGLAILLPGLKKYPNKDVIIRVNTSSQYSELFIRSGRLLSALSVSADFIINKTGKPSDLNTCLGRGDCIIATSLNITLGFSAAIRAQHINNLQGLLHSLYVHDIEVIDSLIDVNVDNMKKIVNSLMSAFRPQINKSLQAGMVINPGSIDQLRNLNITGFMGQPFLDYISMGLLFDL